MEKKLKIRYKLQRLCVLLVAAKSAQSSVVYDSKLFGSKVEVSMKRILTCFMILLEDKTMTSYINQVLDNLLFLVYNRHMRNGKMTDYGK